MKAVHQVHLSVFCKIGDDEGLILSRLKSLIPFDIEKEKININRSSTEGFENKKIIIFKVVLEKERHTNMFLDSLKEKLSKDQKDLLLKQIDSRLDEDLRFFIRLDKEKMLDNEYYLTDSGNCFHIKMSIAAFPAKRENALGVVKKFILE